TTDRSQRIEHAVAGSFEQTVRIEEERRLESPRRSRQLRVLVAGSDRAQCLVNQCLARLEIIGAKSLIRPDRERDRGNYEERKERQRQTSVVRVDPSCGPKARPPDKSLLRQRADQPEKSRRQQIQKEYQHTSLGARP